MDTSEILNLLGHQEDTRLCIISCDNLGFSHSCNMAIFDALNSHAATCARVQITAPWAREVISLYQGEDLGVALTFTSDHPIFRISPITQSPTLLDGAGAFPATRNEFWEHADTDEVRRECRAQIERAIYYGFDPSHISSEAEALTLRPEFFDILLDIAIEFGLPIKIPDSSATNSANFPANELAWTEKVISPNQRVVDFSPDSSSAKLTIESIEDVVRTLKPGISELAFRPSLPSDELTALAGLDSGFFADTHAILKSDKFRSLLRDNSIKTIGYRELKFAQSEIADSSE